MKALNTITIGKYGINDSTINHIKNLIKKHKLLRIKILPSYIKGKDKNSIFQEIAQKTNTKIIKTIGFTLIIKK